MVIVDFFRITGYISINFYTNYLLQLYNAIYK